ncbi:MAG: ABC transporter substrate-binding protein [Solirubrobacteraceae bacterium]|nr:ABC transporter substrate-binding protein [Solirubrobacteraceae bacterium]
MRGVRAPRQHVTDEQWAHIVAELTRRELIGGGLTLGTLALLGCGDDDEVSNGTERAGYPRTVSHAYGSTTIERVPTRLVTLGYTDVDVALALGVTPVGFRDFFGTGLNPWAEPLAGAGDPEAIEYGERAPVERILALRPDLVVASTGMPRADYEALAGVVTTVGPGGDEATVVAWRTQVRQMARSLAREARAERLIDGLEARYAAARRAHPQFARRTLVWTFPAQGGYSVYFSKDTRMQTLTELGFRLPASIAELDDGSFSTVLSAEQVQRLDADVLIVQTYTPEQRRTTERSTLFQNLDVVKRDDVIWMPEQVADGVTFGTVVSIPYVLDDLLALLADKLPSRTGR